MRVRDPRQSVKRVQVRHRHCDLCQEMQTMSAGTSPQSIGPQTPLSSTEIVKLLMKFISDEFANERDHTNAKITQVVTTLRSVAETLANHNAVQETIVTDLALKLNTSNLYFEQLLSRLKAGLQGAFLRIERDMFEVFTKVDSCSIRNSSSEKVHDSNKHAYISLPAHPQQHRPGAAEHEEDENADNNTTQDENQILTDGDNESIIFLSNPSTTVGLQFASKFSDSSSETNLCLNNHVDTEHDGVNASVIPQYDGPLQELPELIQDPNSTSVRTANFTLNQNKQTERIKHDAAINDYEVTVNNMDQNATIKCSTGFYIQVARSSTGKF